MMASPKRGTGSSSLRDVQCILDSFYNQDNQRRYGAAGEDMELEARIHLAHGKPAFDRLLANSPVAPSFDIKCLDVYFEDVRRDAVAGCADGALVRARYVGDENIRRFLTYDSSSSSALPPKPSTLTCKHMVSRIEIPNGHLVLCWEEPLEWTDAVAAHMHAQPKGYRMKHTFSYETIPCKARLDLSVVRRSDTASALTASARDGGGLISRHPSKDMCLHSSIGSSGLASAQETFECELEMLPLPRTSDMLVTRPTQSKLCDPLSARELMDGITEVVRSAMDEKQRALDTYLHTIFTSSTNTATTGGDYEAADDAQLPPSIDTALQSPRKFFFAPQPVALRQANLLLLKMHTHAHMFARKIFSSPPSYAVTMKLDGVRRLMIGDDTGKLMLLDSNLNVEDIGLPRCPMAAYTVCDCEYLPEQRSVHVFDIYFHKKSTPAFLAGGGALPAIEDCRSFAFMMPLASSPQPGGTTTQPLASPSTAASAAADASTSRYALVRDLCSNIQKTAAAALAGADAYAAADVVEVRAKEFYECTRANVEKLLLRAAAASAHKCSTPTTSTALPSDGLIFTPCFLPVGGLFMGARPSHGTWYACFKWKPTHTIDFLVTRAGSLAPSAVRATAVVDLMVAAASSSASLSSGGTTTTTTTSSSSSSSGSGSGVHPHSTSSLLQRTTSKFSHSHYRNGTHGNNNNNNNNSHHIRFGTMAWPPAPLGDDNANQQIRNAAIPAVMECKWDRAEGAWKAVRVRYDKFVRRDSRWAPNSIATALDTWSCIMEDITAERLLADGASGSNSASPASSPSLLPPSSPALPHHQSLGMDEVQKYYNPINNAPRHNMASAGMMRFHNERIKSQELIAPSLRHARALRVSVLDIACGRGGDLFKWMGRGGGGGGGCGRQQASDSTEVAMYIGLDICESNLLDPHTGACSRASKLPYNHRKHVFFLHADARKSLTSDASSGTIDDCMKSPDSRVIAQHLRGLRQVEGLACYGWWRDEGTFDLVSCQFALHYFFESEDILMRFVENVSRNLKAGGRFIGTCLDGAAVDSEMRRRGAESKGAVIVGRLPSDHDYVLWCIQRKYTFDQPLIGRCISVYLESTGQFIDEFLVDFEYFRYAMLRFGSMELVSTSMFEELHDAAAYPMCTTEKEYSRMNRCFVFEKKP